MQQNKRQTLKVLSGTALAAMTPGLSASLVVDVDSAVPVPATGHAILSVRFNRSSDAGTQHVTLANDTEQVITLTQLYPGLVGVGRHIFDLNHLLGVDGVTVAAGGAQTFELNAVRGSVCECRTPAGVAFNRALRVETPIGEPNRVLWGAVV